MVVSNLPVDYKQIYSIDLKKDKKASVLVNALAIIIAIVLVILMSIFKPISFEINADNLSGVAIKMFAISVLVILYTVLHELVHGVAMKLCGTKKVKYGFTGLYAFAGSDDYYGKKAYIFIALAPVVLWGVVLAVINLFVPEDWFWVIYIIQVFNISGAAGDLFVTVKFSGLPKDSLVKDHGVGMAVYSKTKIKE